MFPPVSSKRYGDESQGGQTDERTEGGWADGRTPDRGLGVFLVIALNDFAISKIV